MTRPRRLMLLHPGIRARARTGVVLKLLVYIGVAGMILSTGVGLLLTIFEQSKQSLSQASLLLQENIVHQQLRVDLREAQTVAQDGEQITITSRDQSTIIWSADANRLYRQAASRTTKSNRPIVLQLPQGCKIRFQLVMSEIPKSATLTLFVDGDTNTGSGPFDLSTTFGWTAHE